MTLSLNSESDDKLIELAKEARKIGAYVELTTQEFGDQMNDSVRTIKITYQTHSTKARSLTRNRV